MAVLSVQLFRQHYGGCKWYDLSWLPSAGGAQGTGGANTQFEIDKHPSIHNGSKKHQVLPMRNTGLQL